jgi:hypothetical protein
MILEDGMKHIKLFAIMIIIMLFGLCYKDSVNAFSGYKMNILSVHGSNAKAGKYGAVWNTNVEEISVLPVATGAIITGVGTEGFSVPINTPVIFEDSEIRVTQIGLCFKTYDGAEITRIVVTDSTKKLADEAYLNISGDYTRLRKGKKLPGLVLGFEEPQVVEGGLSIWIEVDFPSGSGSDIKPPFPQQPRVHFVSAVVDLWRTW